MVGDTIWAEDSRRTKLRIRLVRIDSPEIGRPRQHGGNTHGQPHGVGANRGQASRRWTPGAAAKRPRPSCVEKVSGTFPRGGARGEVLHGAAKPGGLKEGR